MNTRSHEVLVVGSGIAGVTAAYYLAKRGYAVTIIDRQRHAAMETSYANGGQISVCNAEVWTRAKTVRQGIQWMFDSDAPLLMNPTPSMSKFRWMAGFLSAAFTGKYLPNTLKTIELGLRSRDAMHHIMDDEQIDYDQSDCGILHIYRNQKALDHAVKMSELMQEHGLERKVVDVDQIMEIEPGLHGARDQLLGGTFTENDFTGDIHKFCRELLEKMVSRGEVEFLRGREVIRADEQGSHVDVDVETARGEREFHKAKIVVVAAGAESSRRFDALRRYHVYPVKGYSITVEVPPHQLHAMPRVSLLDDERKLVSSTLGNRFRVAGTAEINGWNRDIREDRIKPLLTWVNELFPELDTEIVMRWACLRPMTPTMMPAPYAVTRRIYAHTGHGHLGWTLCAATGEDLAEAVKKSHQPLYA